MSAPRILIGSLFLEAHSFTQRRTTLADFVLSQGAELLEKLRTSQTALAGAARVLSRAGATVIPAFSAIAPPGGLARQADYIELKQRLLAIVADSAPDAILLDLHGAMGTTEIDDAEGDVVEALRQVVGPDMPIAVSLDMHASVTRRMLMATPLWVAYKKNPHTDCEETGARTARLLLDVLHDQWTPAICAVWLPAVLPGQLSTDRGPLAALHELRRELEQAAELGDLSLYNTYAFLDAAEAGQCVTAIGSDVDAARSAAETLARALWQSREAFSVDRPSLAIALADKMAGEGPPLIIGDHGDRVLGGGVGDGTYVLRHLRKERPDLRTLIPVTDPKAVDAARAAGLGATLSCTVGGYLTQGEIPVTGTWHIKHLGDGLFVQDGPFLAGEPADMGMTAVLTSGNTTLLVSSKPGLSQDPQAFISNGEHPSSYDVVVAKSGFHFEPAFRSSGHCVAVDTPGMTNYLPGHLVFERRPPCWPEDPDIAADFAVSIFHAETGRSSQRSDIHA